MLVPSRGRTRSAGMYLAEVLDAETMQPLRVAIVAGNRAVEERGLDLVARTLRRPRESVRLLTESLRVVE